MTITSTINRPASLNQIATGIFEDTGTVNKSAFKLGFKPKYVKVMDVTAHYSYEWIEGMADDTAIKTDDAGAETLLGSGGISVSDLDTGTVSTWTVYDPTTVALGADTHHLNAVNEIVRGFNIPAALVTTSHVLYFLALG